MIYNYEDFDYYNQCLEQIEQEIANTTLNEAEEKEKLVDNRLAIGALIGGVSSGAIGYVTATPDLDWMLSAAKITSKMKAAEAKEAYEVAAKHRDELVVVLKKLGKAKSTASYMRSLAIVRGLKYGLISAAAITAATIAIRAYRNYESAKEDGNPAKLKKAKIEFDAAKAKLEKERKIAGEKWKKASPEKKADVMKKIK